MTGAPAPEHRRSRAAVQPFTQTGFHDVDVNPPAAVADAHLLDVDLLSPAASGLKHLAECGWCQQRQQTAERHRDDFDDDDFLHAARQRAETGGVAALAHLTRLTPQLQALTGDAIAREDVSAGQLWRLRWGQVTELAVVVGIDRWWVTVAPVTTDVNAADEYSVLLPPTASALDTAIAVCFSLECTVPLFVFDRLIAPASRPTLDNEQAAAQLPPPDAARDVWRAWRRGSGVPPNLTYGCALDDGDLDRRELRSVIAASFTVLVGASACIPGSPRGEVVPLAQRVRDLGLRPSALAEQTGIGMEVFMRINRGGRVTRAEAEKLAPYLDTDAQTVLDANPALDDELVVEVSSPHRRLALRRLAQADGTEDTQRWAAAESVSTHAARTVSSRPASASTTSAQASWAAKVDIYLQHRLAELGESS
ncbi:hypothetical protein AB0K00_21830 [Dactylosporangium sp. NPDC049525]|uniref:hypothetical protein n=1 Tax=Dactylosporangium sp. NPDC049525 TaxID=3154730 RepID=UPI00342FBDCA